MTNINLITQDQQLINANKVVIASGDINSVELNVEFDSTWDIYPARSATFYTSKNEAVQEMLLLNNKCIVPFEVLEESCVLFIGVRGVSADGTAVKTSSLVKYKISEGAPVGDKTLTPTMDLYQQYLAALKAKADPIIAEIRAAAQAEAAAAIAEVEAAAKQSFSEIEGTVLWEVDSLEGFAPQTDHSITFDASKYKTFRVRWGQYETTVSEKGKTIQVCHDTVGSKYFNITITDDGATFRNSSSSASVKILGYTY